MSEDWPRGWYSDEPERPGAADQRTQPSFTPSSRGGLTRAGLAGQGPQSAWPAQPPSRSWTGGTGAGSGRRGWRRWLRPRRVLVILASLVVLAVLATVGVYFSVSSKLTRVNVLVPTVVHLGRDELADHGLRQPRRADRGAGKPAGPRARHHRRPFGHDHAAAPAGQRDPSHAGQHPARLLRADPGERLQQDQRRLRLRRAEAADRDRAERHRAADQPLHGHRLRRAGQRGQRRRRRAHVPERRR